MIAIDVGRCNGCGKCVEVCPDGAIYLVDDKAEVEASLCRDCRACIGACPREAISLVQRPRSVETVQLPVPQTEPAVVQIQTAPAPRPLRTRVLPVMGAALVWAGREIVPRLADRILDNLAYQATEKRTTSSSRRVSSGCGNGQGRGGGRGGGGGGRRRRQRRRGV